MSNQRLKIGFWGTPELTTTILDALANAGYAPCVIVTNPDRPQGRNLVLTATSAKLWGQTHDIPVLTPEKIGSVFLEEIQSYHCDLFVVVAYGKILPEAIISMPHYGTLNVHYSLLPRWRGATPVESAILAGDTETGVCVQQMVYKLDAGPIHDQVKISIHPNETAPKLRTRLNEIGKVILVETITKIANGSTKTHTQDETQMTRCGKITKEDGLIDPNGDPILNDRKFRAYYGWPGTYFFLQQGEKQLRVIVKDAHLENGAFMITRIIPEGKKEMAYADFLK